MRLARVEVKIDPYPTLQRTKMWVTVAGQAKSVGGGVWRAGREVTVETEASQPDADMREQLELTLARALDELEVLGE